MNSDLEDENEGLEPPLRHRFSAITSHNFPAHYPKIKSSLNSSNLQNCESRDGYDSDRIDPELEELLYTSIHHQTISSMELSFDHSKLQADPPTVSADEIHLNECLPTIKSDDVKIFNTRKSLKKERKEIKVAKDKALAAAEAACQFTIDSTKSSKKLDLCFGNLIVGEEIKSTLNPEDAMNKFYNEDSYDSDEERASYKRMSSDRRFWKIGREDLLANFGRRGTSYSYRQKSCKKCGGNGHLVKDCPRKLLCYICGDVRHIGQKCRLRICAICMEPGHLSHKCPVRYDLKTRHCNVCGQNGHIDKQCTQSWRKFLNVTDEETYLAHQNSSIIPNDPVVVNSVVSCSNCGAMGKHFTCECPCKDMDNMRFQMPLPVANWHKIRKEQAVKRNEQPPKNRSRKSASQPSSFNMPSTSTQSAHTSWNCQYTSKTKAAKGKSIKRPLSPKPEEDIEEIVLDSDSNDSVQYVLDLLKGSTQINDTPVSSGSKKSRPYSHMNINVSSSKKKKSSNVPKNTAKFNNYKQKRKEIFKQKNNYIASPSANSFQSSYSSTEKAQLKKRKQRDYSERRFKRKTKNT